jgi:uncharacterized protein YndB with AHSA1/START domain
MTPNHGHSAAGEVKVSSQIKAKTEEVFNAWIDPSMITQWMFGPNVRKENLIKIETHPIEGGCFSFMVEREGHIINHVGQYLEVSPYNRLVFTWGIESESESESTVQVDISPTGEGCLLQVTHQLNAKWDAYRNLTQQGWSFMLDKLQAIFG